MQKNTNDILLSLIVLGAICCLVLYNLFVFFFPSKEIQNKPTNKPKIEIQKVTLSESDWKERLTPLQYDVMRLGAMEPAYSGKYVNSNELGIYHCAGCRNELFDSKSKIDSTTGWATFTTPISSSAILCKKTTSIFWDNSLDVLCSHCDSYLGHMFRQDATSSTDKYCINSVALEFVPLKKEEKI